MTDKVNAASLVKRGTPSCWPHELTVVEDPSDPLYDERLGLPVSDERIRNFAIVGQVQPIAVRVRGNDLVIVAGRQRWKRATVINHVSGVHPYRGKLQPVLDAIERIRGTDLEKLIADRVSSGMKLTFILNRGTEKDSTRAATSENEQRDEDPIDAKIRRAQRLARQGFTPEDTAADFGVSVQTVKRWLGRDLERPKEKKERGKAARPSSRKLKAVYAQVNLLKDPKIVLAWAMGIEPDSALVAHAPGLSAALGQGSDKAAA